MEFKFLKERKIDLKNGLVVWEIGGKIIVLNWEELMIVF